MRKRAATRSAGERGHVARSVRHFAGQLSRVGRGKPLRTIEAFGQVARAAGNMLAAAGRMSALPDWAMPVRERTQGVAK